MSDTVVGKRGDYRHAGACCQQDLYSDCATLSAAQGVASSFHPGPRWPVVSGAASVAGVTLGWRGW